MSVNERNKELFPFFYPKSGQITFRVTDDEVKYYNDYFEPITGSSHFTTFKEFVNCAVDKAVQTVQPVVKAEKELKELKAENAKLITLLNEQKNQNSELSGKIDALKTTLEEKEKIEQSQQQELTELKEQNEIKEHNEEKEQKELQELNKELESEIEILKSKLIETAENPHVIEKKVEILTEKALSENQIIVSFSNIEKGIIEHVSMTETKRLNKSISPEYLLKQVFFAQALTGFGDHIHPRSLISKEVLNKIKSKFIPKKNV